MRRFSFVVAVLLACKAPIPPSPASPPADAGAVVRDAGVEESHPSATAVQAPPCGPTRVSAIGSHAFTVPYWGPNDILMDGTDGLDPETFAPRPVATTALPSQRWTVIPGPDNTIDAVIDTRSGKKVPIAAAYVRAELGIAVDVRGRVVDLATAKTLTNDLDCGGTKGATYRISLSGKLVICDAHGAGVALLEISANRRTDLGDGELVLAPDETYGVMIPGPFDGYWGHVETRRTTLDKITWRDGQATTTTIGPHDRVTGPSVEVGSEVYVLVSGRRATIHRACDDAVIYDDPAARPAGNARGSPAGLSRSGKYLLLAGETLGAILRIE